MDENMHRRGFLRQLAVGGAAAAAGTAFVRETRDRVATGFEQLEKRVDKLEHHHRNLLRVGAIALAISTGIDLSILL